MLAQFGAQPSKADIESYARSKQWNREVFENAEPTTIGVSFLTLPKMLYKQFVSRENREPGHPLPILPFDWQKFNESREDFTAVWFGHSALLMRIAGVTIFIDPMLGPNAAPVSPFPVRRFSENTLDI